MTMRRFGGKVALVATAVVLAAACTSGDDSASDSTDAGTTPGSSAPVATGPAPGVTDDTIKIGITYTDAAALQAVGLDYEAWQYAPGRRRPALAHRAAHA